MLIAVPTGIKIFNWLGTMWGGKIRFATPMLFCIAFLFQFLCAGLTGVMLAVAPFDWQLSDSYFVVAHFHYVLIGGLLFTIFAAIYYWFPKVTGPLLSERLGKWHFWLFVIGFNLTFVPQHISGILGMPRRIYTYQAGRGFELWNLLSSIGVDLPDRRHARSWCGTSSARCAAANPPATTRGTRGRWSGRPLRRRRPTTSRPSRSCAAAARCGISSIRRIRTGSTNDAAAINWSGFGMGRCLVGSGDADRQEDPLCRAREWRA